MDNAALMKQAREVLDGKWGIAVGGCFLYLLITILVGEPDDIGPFFSLLVDGPMMLGLSVFTLALARKQEASISQLFVGFNDFVRNFVDFMVFATYSARNHSWARIFANLFHPRRR